MKRLFVILFFLNIFFVISCVSKTDPWHKTVAKNTPEAYRSYIFNHPDSDEVGAAYAQLELLTYKRIIKSNNIADYKRFLKEYPKSKYKNSIITKLTELRAKKALKSNNIWELKRFLHLHGKSEIAKKVRKKLEKLWWMKIEKHPFEPEIKKYITYFRTGIYYMKAKILLAKINYDKLGNNIEKIKAYIIAFSDTSYAIKARKRYIGLKNDEKLMQGKIQDLQKVLKSGLYTREIVDFTLNRFLRKAIVNVDIDLLNKVCEIDTEKRICTDIYQNTLKRWKKYKKYKLHKLRLLVQKANHWKPNSIRALQYALNSFDLRIVWIGLESLAYSDEPEAFFSILMKIGVPQPEISWIAQKSLKLWYKRNIVGRDLIIKYTILKMQSKLENPSFYLRNIFLRHLLGLKKNIEFNTRYLPKEYKFIFKSIIFETGQTYNKYQLSLFFEKSLKSLKTIFPKTIVTSNYSSALYATRKLFVLSWKLENLLKNTPQKNMKLKLLLENMKSLYSLWSFKVNKVKPYHKIEFPIMPNINKWEENRTKYLKKLKLQKGEEGKFWKFFKI